MLWIDENDVGRSWMQVWNGKFNCGRCSGIIDSATCPICGYKLDTSEKEFTATNGSIHKIPQIQVAGAITYMTFTYLNLIRREWERPLTEEDRKLNLWANEIPQRLSIVLLFWSLFEHLMDKLISDGLKNIPENISKNLLKRFSSVGSRMGDLYKLTFSSSMKEDLVDLECERIHKHLINLQEKRNKFIHGNPHAIDEQLVSDTMHYLQESQLAWICLYNKNCTKQSKK